MLIKSMENGLRDCGLWQNVGNKRVVNEKRARTLEEFEFREETNVHVEDEISIAEGKRRKLEPGLNKMHQNSISKGDQIKNAGEVLKECANKKRLRINCRVVGFGKICQSLDNRRKKWVREMGFEGLLYLVDRCLSIDLCYWLMTRIDPCNELFRAPDGHEYKLSKDQVRWILGIPKGDRVVPRRVGDEEMKSKVRDIENNFGEEWETRLKTSEKVKKQKGIRITSALIARAKGSWGEEEEAEFKTVFLILALHLVLCPTQSYKLESDLVPALTCAMEAKNYDWCVLVLEKLFDSCRRFGKKFYVNGYAKGFGGCSIFLAIFYLDRLDRYPIMWCRWPRIKVWTTTEMVKAGDEDRLAQQGDFGSLGCIDVDYGKKHPRDAMDTDGTSFVEKGTQSDNFDQTADLNSMFCVGETLAETMASCDNADKRVSKNLADYSDHCPSQSPIMEGNSKGALPCSPSSLNVAEGSHTVDNVGELCIETIPSSDKNNSLNISHDVGNHEIVPSLSTDNDIEKVVKGMDLLMEQVETCRRKCVNMSNDRSADCVTIMHTETFPSYDDKAISPRKSHDIVNEVSPRESHDIVNEVSPKESHDVVNEVGPSLCKKKVDNEVPSSTNTQTAEIDKRKKTHEHTNCNKTEVATDEHGKEAKSVNMKLVSSSFDNPVIIEDDNEDDKENDDLIPFDSSGLESRISKLERIVLKKQAAKLQSKAKRKAHVRTKTRL